MHVRLSFYKSDMDAPLNQLEDELTQIVEVAGQPIHSMTDNGVSFADEAEHCVELWPVCVFAGNLVREHPVGV